ncbi:MAG: 50S ribosomal protein L5 [Myxococcaceae bacterium]|nr:50S ribosomal protein L5 [Myxococcaceae bacterium]MBH2006960.1 50S ribosomal protein L5 [Myxococcaceae bacterium]
MARLKKYYDKELVSLLMKELELKNPMQTPKLQKIVLNMGLGEAVANPKAIEAGKEALETISGQKAVITKAKKSIATYKLRQGLPIGVSVTLRRERMWEFLDRFVNIALPRVRDFRGIGSKFDGQGNCSIGVKEHIIFPEINYDKVDKIRGFNVSLVTSAGDDKAGKALLKHLGVPFRK